MFFIFAICVMLFMSFYTVRSLLGKDKVSPYTLIVFALMLSAIMARISVAVMGVNPIIYFFAWLGYITIGVVSILFCVAVVKDIMYLFEKKAVHKKSDFSPSRRRFLSQSMGTGMAVATFPVAGYGVYRAAASPKVKTVYIEKENLPESLDGFKFVQLTDIHVGPTIGIETVRDIVSISNDLNPDAVLITGDLVDGSASLIHQHISPLKNLKSRYGTFFTTGNHEYYSGAEDWIREVKKLGIQVFDNEHTIISKGDGKLLLAGIPDLTASEFGFVGASPFRAKLTSAKYDMAVLMSHRPEIAEISAKSGYDLQISGHTHGGQYFPWTVVIHLFQKYVRGLYQIDNMKLYVSQGTAYWGPPVRIGAESEITEIILKRV